MTVLNCTSDTAMADEEKNGSSHVKVIVRVRPPNDREVQGLRKNIVEIVDENVLVFDPKEETSPSAFLSRHSHSRRHRHRDLRKRRQKDLKFGFDHVFGWTSSNVEVFEHTTKTVLDGLFGGYNCSVFAYGATGSGKTHTMLGNESNPGVIYHTMIHLYNHIGALSGEKTCDVAVSYLEIYNEQIRDLLNPRGTLPLREDRNAGVTVQGLSLHKPSSAEELLHMLQFGNQNRTQHPTDGNAESSRSHAVFQLYVRQRDRTANLCAQVKVGKMCLVDLAGSERATVNRNRGARFREGANINRSLLALGNVINSLADQKHKGHIPYRDSKLTRLLKDSLGGNCRTIMIAAISPSELSYEDTYNTLKYADRAKSIRLDMKKNVLNVDFHVSQYGKIVQELRKEIAELKFKLQQSDKPSVSCAQALCLPSNLQSLHEKLQVAYGERRTVREQQLRQEINMRNTQWRLYRKHKGLHRVSQLAHVQPENVVKLKQSIEGLQRKVMCQEAERLALCHHLNTNTSTLQFLQSQTASADNKGSLPHQLVETSIEKMLLEVEVNDAHQYINHLRHLARAQEQEAVASETVITALLQLVQKQQLELQKHGPVCHELKSDYDSVCNMLGTWGVSWAQEDSPCPSPEMGDQADFNINSIINIPLLTSEGVVLTGHRTVDQDTITSSGADGLKTTTTSQVKGAPGRMVKGQVVFSTPTPTTTTPTVSSLQPPQSYHAAHSCFIQPNGQLVTLGAQGDNSHWPPSSQLITSSAQGAVSNWQPPSSGLVSEPLAAPSSAPDRSASPCVMAGHPSWSEVVRNGPQTPAVTRYAGHTPNPKMLQLKTDHHHHSNQDQGAACSAPASHSSRTSHHVPCCLNASPAPTLNESCVVVEQGDVINGDNVSGANSQSVVLKSGPPVCLPAVDSNRNNSACTEEASVVPRDRPVAESISNSKGQRRLITFAEVVSGTPSPFSLRSRDSLSSTAKAGISVKLAAAPGHGSNSTAKVSFKQVTTTPGQGSSSVRVHNDENVVPPPHQKPPLSVRRTINFDGVGSDQPESPLRVEGKSYADAVRTPTPPRQPLRTLGCNSPQVQAANLPAGGHQGTPKSSGMYSLNSKDLDNVRRLKKLGMPSLVENLLVPHYKGGGESSKPSYMLPTQAHMRRVRVQSKDDCYNPPRRIPKSLAHSRSKSATQMNKTGWKI